MSKHKILLENENALEIQSTVRQGLRDNDPVSLPPRQRDYQPLNLALRDSNNEIIGGLYGMIMWSWLMIDGLWVAEIHRGKGLGSQLLSEAEGFAIQNGCCGTWLGTFDFQGQDFYERHGYSVFAELDGFPTGHKHLHLRKLFTSPA
jgi:GNAT superfamily N-acetyltransferase